MLIVSIGWNCIAKFTWNEPNEKLTYHNTIIIIIREVIREIFANVVRVAISSIQQDKKLA